MYEHKTFESLLEQMLDYIRNDVDKREGSLVYSSSAAAAVIFAQLYADLTINDRLSFADTSSGEYLSRRTAEHGVNRYGASKARRKGLFFNNEGKPVDVPIGTRFSIGDLNYIVLSRIEKGQYALECEVTGVVGNEQFGTLLPIDYVEGLSRAELADVLIPGEDEEDDEALRLRFFEAVNEKPFGGNIADYKQKINAIAGVGGVKVFPTWRGGGTVKCTIIASDFSPPSPELVDEVQTIMDPEVNQGKGLGLAPVGHHVTIMGAKDVTVNVETTVILAAGTTIGQVQDDIENAVSLYFSMLRRTWKDEDNITVRMAQIDARILTVPGVVDVKDTKLNGVSENIDLDAEEIPTQGQVVING
ncbi:baseplate J/gp47 family protein [Bacillus chungangensis]|uniref:Phage protein gp47/JayE n=1 Tax=Bacillus chungangensis TaxID=587633 RepID=A0ABT9WRQ2_9BACI|nr:baseplate J/gp47 family protein [Bacillus chungangensis]MDQ0175975.1 putative phage protein gp47/JayE [Bacillus chungangensis]